MKVVFIAGPYRAKNAWEMEKNVREAEFAGMWVAEAGGVAIVPHTMSRFFSGTLTEEYWLQATLEMMRRCDGVRVLSLYEGSVGTLAEITEARALGKPIFYAHNDRFEAWLKETP